MKVYYFEIDLPVEVDESPEFNRVLDIFISLMKRMYKEYSIDNGLFIAHQTFDVTVEKGIIFCDDFLIQKFHDFLNYIKSNFIGIKSFVEEITLDVKLNRCKNQVFIDLFDSEESDVNNIYNLIIYLDTYVTHDDIFIKVFEQGVDSLTDSEKNILETASKSL